jgi:hypothetical protein
LGRAYGWVQNGSDGVNYFYTIGALTR